MTLFTVIKTWTLVLVSTSLVFLLLNGLFVGGLTWDICSRGLAPPNGSPLTPEEQNDSYGDLLRPPPIQITTWAWFPPEVDPLGSGPNYAYHRIGVPLIWFEHNRIAHDCSESASTLLYR
jgi:hypothetical protein